MKSEMSSILLTLNRQGKTFILLEATVFQKRNFRYAGKFRQQTYLYQINQD